MAYPQKTDPFTMLGFGSKTGWLGGVASKWYSPEQIIGYLHVTEVLLAKGSTIGQVFRKIGVTEQKYYRWWQDYVSLSVDQAKPL